MDKSLYTGILLAGGKSSRFGVNKALVEFKGQRMADYSLKLLTDHCKTILISTNQALPYQYQQIADVTDNGGPMTGIYSCMLHVLTPNVLVLTCDMPFVNAGLIEALAEKANGDNIVVPTHGNNLMEPLCAIYPISMIDSFDNSIREKQLTLHNFIESHSHYKLMPSKGTDWWNEQLFANINTLTELSAYDKP